MAFKSKTIKIQFMDPESAEKLFDQVTSDIKKVLLDVTRAGSMEAITDYALSLVEALDEAMVLGYQAGLDAGKEMKINGMPAPVVKKDIVN